MSKINLGTDKKRFTREEHIARARSFRAFALAIANKKIADKYTALAEYHEQRAAKMVE